MFCCHVVRVSPLVHSTSNCTALVVRFLTPNNHARAGADCHLADSLQARTPLHWAVISGFLDCIIQLLERAGTESLDALDSGERCCCGCTHRFDRHCCPRPPPHPVHLSDHHTPLLLAILHKNHELASFLVKKGANLNISDREGNTPLHVAAGFAHESLVSLLVNKGRRVDSGGGRFV